MLMEALILSSNITKIENIKLPYSFPDIFLKQCLEFQ